MYKVKCPECKNVRKVKTKKTWMIGEPPYSKICKSCTQLGKNKTKKHRLKLSASMVKADTSRLQEFLINILILQIVNKFKYNVIPQVVLK